MSSTIQVHIGGTLGSFRFNIGIWRIICESLPFGTNQSWTPFVAYITTSVSNCCSSKVQLYIRTQQFDFILCHRFSPIECGSFVVLEDPKNNSPSLKLLWNFFALKVKAMLFWSWLMLWSFLDNAFLWWVVSLLGPSTPSQFLCVVGVNVMQLP